MFSVTFSFLESFIHPDLCPAVDDEIALMKTGVFVVFIFSLLYFPYLFY